MQPTTTTANVRRPRTIEVTTIPNAAGLIPIKGATHYLGVSMSLVLRLVGEGRLTRVKLGRRTFIRKAELDALGEAKAA